MIFELPSPILCQFFGTRQIAEGHSQKKHLLHHATGTEVDLVADYAHMDYGNLTHLAGEIMESFSTKFMSQNEKIVVSAGPFYSAFPVFSGIKAMFVRKPDLQ